MVYIYIYISVYICVCCTFITREYTEDFTGSTFKKKGNDRLGKQAMEVARLVNDEETTADLKSKGKNTGYTRDDNSCQ